MWQGYAQHRPATLEQVRLENFARVYAAAFEYPSTRPLPAGALPTAA